MDPIDRTQIDFMQVDLGDLKSVKAFSQQINKRFKKVDILLNNAGIGRFWRETTK